MRRAPQFEKANALAAEVARLQAQYDAVHPDEPYSLRVGGMLRYEMDDERFRVELFDPGKFVNFNPRTCVSGSLTQIGQARLQHPNPPTRRRKNPVASRVCKERRS